MKTILIVADAAASGHGLRQRLQDDYTVLTAADGAAALALVQRTDPDLIFMALPPPDSAAAEALEPLKVRARQHGVPLIALTDRDVPTQTVGCADVLRTPLDTDRLDATLRRWLGGG